MLLVVVGAGLAWYLGREDSDAGDDSPAADAGERRSAATALSTGDVDGDGADDIILVDDAADETLVLRSDLGSDSGFGDLETWSGSAYGSARVVRGDFTGDDRADLAAVESDGVRVAASADGAFEESGDGVALTLPDRFRVSVGDFDADGVDDLALVTEQDGSGVLVEVARGGDGGLTSPQPWVTLDAVLDDLKLGTADMDGDGRSDLVAMGRGEQGVDVRVLRSLGDAFDSAETWSEQPEWSWDGTRPLLGDVDADGRADVIALRDLGSSLQVGVLRSDGERLQPEGDVVEIDLDLDRTRSVAADTDGDGRTDLVLGDRATSQIRRLHRDGGAFRETGRVPVDAGIDRDGSILVSATR